MKNLTILIVLIALNSYSQSPIIDIENYKYSTIVEDAYYKDINNYFDDFIGTWIFVNGNTSFKIVLGKREMTYTGKFYIDGIIGEYRYVENGSEQVNTLSNISYQFNHGIWGATLLGVDDIPYCDECMEEHERRLKVAISDKVTGLTGTIIFRKTEVNGEPALEGSIWGDGVGPYDETNPPQYFEMIIPTGTFLFTKE